MDHFKRRHEQRWQAGEKLNYMVLKVVILSLS